MDKNSPLVKLAVSLTEINCSQHEISYITRMRNAIKFQNARSKEYEYFNFTFRHIILCLSTPTATLETCLRHSFYKILKSHVLVHNYTPFQQWTLISIDNDGFPEEHNPGQQQELIQRKDEYDQAERYLIANFRNARQLSADSEWIHWNLLQRQLLRDTRLSDLQINNVDILNSVHTSGWRRMFADNFIDFSCTDSSTAAYVREQTEESRPIHVFKEISKRERGETINHLRILEFIASPYYYVLPHHCEVRHDGIKNISDNSQTSVQDDPPAEKEMFYFESQLRIAKKITPRLD
ncbi:uncharacterized protein TNIN_164871 [Trichonephila inaurata madagascariensis]|uniref:Uncharacterized protein n=1 Tax=Trichonephila inaurata madagascariensis TaxID=2747483 RepID=A0A8X7C0V3_9ARAC|nr:uncharacterized protein TNIN_164871 [Trichonephila inaurata madagascariensis]